MNRKITLNITMVTSLVLVTLAACQGSYDRPHAGRKVKISGGLLDKEGSAHGKNGESKDARIKGRSSPFFNDDEAPEQEHGDEIEQLATILSELSTIYGEALFSMTTDKIAKPRNFFENLSYLLKKGEVVRVYKSKPNDYDLSDGSDELRRCSVNKKVVLAIDTEDAPKTLSYFDCQKKTYFPIVKFKATKKQWELRTDVQGVKNILSENLLGFINTMVFNPPLKPSCIVTLRANELKIEKAECKDWGQKISVPKNNLKAPAADRTLLINRFTYDTQSPTLLETEAQYLEYNDELQPCRSGQLKRSAPKANQNIIIQDKGDDKCPAIETKKIPNQQLNQDALKKTDPAPSTDGAADGSDRSAQTGNTVDDKKTQMTEPQKNTEGDSEIMINNLPDLMSAPTQTETLPESAAQEEQNQETVSEPTEGGANDNETN